MMLEQKRIVADVIGTDADMTALPDFGSVKADARPARLRRVGAALLRGLRRFVMALHEQRRREAARVIVQLRALDATDRAARLAADPRPADPEAVPNLSIVYHDGAITNRGVPKN